MGGMDRLDLELYSERLSRHAQRAADALADARMHRSWLELDGEAERLLEPAETARLRALGLMVDERAAQAIERSVEERVLDLAAIVRLQALVERLRCEERQAGATAISRPPSAS